MGGPRNFFLHHRKHLVYAAPFTNPRGAKVLSGIRDESKIGRCQPATPVLTQSMLGLEVWAGWKCGRANGAWRPALLNGGQRQPRRLGASQEESIRGRKIASHRIRHTSLTSIASIYE